MPEPTTADMKAKWTMAGSLRGAGTPKEFDTWLAGVIREAQREVIGTFGARAFDGLSVVDLCHHARTTFDLLGEDEEPYVLVKP